MNKKHMKTKEPSVSRTYDEDGFRKRSACICVNSDQTQVLLVTSRKDVNQWIVPGGGIEPEEEPDVAAVREVREEAGVAGVLGRCLGLFENQQSNHRTSVFVMEVTEEFDEWEEMRTLGRKRRWFPLEEAVHALHKPHQSNYIKLLLPPEHRHSLTTATSCGSVEGDQSCLGSHGRRVLVHSSSTTNTSSGDDTKSADGSCNKCGGKTNIIISNFIVKQHEDEVVAAINDNSGGNDVVSPSE